MAINERVSKSTGDVADEIGAELVSRLQRALIDKGKLASGSLIGQMSYEVKTDSQGRAVVNLFAEDYFRFVDRGRGPGKQPPLEEIKKWTRLKFISEKLAFPIAAKIGRVGIPGINIINPTIDMLLEEFTPLYEEQIAQFVGVVLVKDVFSATNTKGRIIPKTLT